MLELQVIDISTIIAVVVGGITMGVYLAYATNCGYTPSLVTLIVLGWSFLIPLSIAQITHAGDVDVGRMTERLALWALFALHARVGARMMGHFRACGDKIFGRW